MEVGSKWTIAIACIGTPNADFGCGSPLGPPPLRLLGYAKKRIKNVIEYQFNTSDIEDTIQSQFYIAQCNKNNLPTTQEQTWAMTISVGIFAAINRDKDAAIGNFRDEYAYTEVPITIRCLAAPAQIQAPPEPYSVEVTPGFQQGQTCPKEFEVKAVSHQVQATGHGQVPLQG